MSIGMSKRASSCYRMTAIPKAFHVLVLKQTKHMYILLGKTYLHGISKKVNESNLYMVHAIKVFTRWSIKYNSSFESKSKVKS